MNIAITVTHQGCTSWMASIAAMQETVPDHTVLTERPSLAGAAALTVGAQARPPNDEGLIRGVPQAVGS